MAARFKSLSPSSRGLGHYPFTVATGVRIPVGTPSACKGIEKPGFGRVFSFWPPRFAVALAGGTLVWMSRRTRQHSPMLRLLLLGVLTLCLLGNGWASATAAMPGSGAPCAGMMDPAMHADCCEHGKPGKPMPADCLEHCYLLGQLAASAPVPAAPALGLRLSLEPMPPGSLVTPHLPAPLAPALRPPISA